MTAEEIETKLDELCSNNGYYLLGSMREAFALGQASMQPLIDAHVEYEKILHGELKELATFASVYGWKPAGYKQREDARAKIKELTK